jgi:hypothetical protein
MSEPAISQSGETLYQRTLPVFATDEDQGWFGRYFCDALMGMFQGLDVIVQDHPAGIHPLTGEPVPGMPEHCGWSIIYDPEVCPDAWLPRCAQEFGVTLPPNATPEVQRRTIKELPPQKRGGIAAMIAAAQPTLTGTKEVHIEEQAEGHAYRLVATTTASQTPNEQATLNALRSQKAGGLKLVYVVTADPPIIDEGTRTIEASEGVVETATLANIT